MGNSRTATWEETQTVRRPPPSVSAGMPTVSTRRPSKSCSRNLTVPSGDACTSCMEVISKTSHLDGKNHIVKKHKLAQGHRLLARVLSSLVILTYFVYDQDSLLDGCILDLNGVVMCPNAQNVKRVSLYHAAVLNGPTAAHSPRPQLLPPGLRYLRSHGIRSRSSQMLQAHSSLQTSMDSPTTFREFRGLWA